MPWTPDEFKQRHNHGLTGAQAQKAAAQANAILRSGGSERVAIATANKNAGKKKAARRRPTPFDGLLRKPTP